MLDRVVDGAIIHNDLPPNNAAPGMPSIDYRALRAARN
jgi:hypothetical protein